MMKQILAGAVLIAALASACAQKKNTEASEIYVADLTPINADKIGYESHGKATFEVYGDSLRITIDMQGTPPNIQHWEHFHGFEDGKQAVLATTADDVNHDGYLDLIETGAVSGTTMVPFNDAPHHMDIPTDTYPVSSAKGDFHYVKMVPLKDLEAKFAEVFKGQSVHLDRRVIYVHGVPNNFKLPQTVAGEVGHYDHHVTLPIAGGVIKKVK